MEKNTPLLRSARQGALAVGTRNRLIQTLGKEEAIRKPAKEVRRLIEQQRLKCEELLNGIIRLAEDLDGYYALTQAGEPTTLAACNGHDRLEREKSNLRATAQWLAMARNKVEPRQPGRNSRIIYHLVANAAAILESHTGRTIKRSYKTLDEITYITTVCRIADPKINTGTIDAAMKSYISLLTRG